MAKYTPKENTDKPKCGCRYVAEYFHYRAKKIMRAVEYGYKAWCFAKCAKHR